MDRLRDAVQKQEEEIERLRSEKETLKNKEKDNVADIKKQEKTVIEEINKECQKTAELLGITPRKTNVPA